MLRLFSAIAQSTDGNFAISSVTVYENPMLAAQEAFILCDHPDASVPVVQEFAVNPSSPTYAEIDFPILLKIFPKERREEISLPRSFTIEDGVVVSGSIPSENVACEPTTNAALPLGLGWEYVGMDNIRKLIDSFTKNNSQK